MVELLIVVSILAIAAIPLMRSMSMSTKANAMAQSLQNATSLGERVMEEVKSSDIAKLVADNGGFDESGECLFTYPLTTATQGENFDVIVTISKGSYSGATAYSDTDKKANVKSANTLLIPKIEDIDTLSQAVLSPKELNKYDTEAKSFFNEKRADYDPEDASKQAKIVTKKIDIVKEDVIYPSETPAKDKPPAVTVTATVTYTDGSGNKYVRELYTGSFTALNRENVPEGSTDLFEPLDSNIYIFYKRNTDTAIMPAAATETIKITDNSNYINTDDEGAKDTHRVYYIRQDGTDWDGPTLEINGTTFTYANVNDDDFKKDGTKEFGKTQLVTNLVKGNKSVEGHIYKEEAKIRVYEVTVVLYKDSKHITTLNSTVSASDMITPTPTTEP